MTTPNWSNGIANCPITAIHVAADGPNGWALSAVGDLYYYNDSQTSWQEVIFLSSFSHVFVSSSKVTLLFRLQPLHQLWASLLGFPLPLIHLSLLSPQKMKFTTITGALGLLLVLTYEAN